MCFVIWLWILYCFFFYACHSSYLSRVFVLSCMYVLRVVLFLFISTPVFLHCCLISTFLLFLVAGLSFFLSSFRACSPLLVRAKGWLISVHLSSVSVFLLREFECWYLVVSFFPLFPTLFPLPSVNCLLLCGCLNWQWFDLMSFCRSYYLCPSKW